MSGKRRRRRSGGSGPCTKHKCRSGPNIKHKCSSFRVRAARVATAVRSRSPAPSLARVRLDRIKSRRIGGSSALAAMPRSMRRLGRGIPDNPARVLMQAQRRYSARRSGESKRWPDVSASPPQVRVERCSRASALREFSNSRTATWRTPIDLPDANDCASNEEDATRSPIGQVRSERDE